MHSSCIIMQAAMNAKQSIDLLQQSMDLLACEELELANNDLAMIYTPVVAT
jgi:hypothetical protein